MWLALTWINLTSRDREQMRHVLDLLSGQATVDEMGLGTIRDAFADALFPGTSSIQTALLSPLRRSPTGKTQKQFMRFISVLSRLLGLQYCRSVGTPPLLLKNPTLQDWNRPPLFDVTPPAVHSDLEIQKS